MRVELISHTIRLKSRVYSCPSQRSQGSYSLPLPIPFRARMEQSTTERICRRPASSRRASLTTATSPKSPSIASNTCTFSLRQYASHQQRGPKVRRN
jgi:hypothetical protein